MGELVSDTKMPAFVAFGLVVLGIVIAAIGNHGLLHGSIFGGIVAASGALASGLAYSIWYVALRGLTAAQAAVVQLCVPALAAAGGALAIGEAVGVRLFACGAAILAGVAFAVRR